VQPVLVFAADGPKLQTVRERASRRGARVAIYTARDIARAQASPLTQGSSTGSPSPS
jgi:hypothetical protein